MKTEQLPPSIKDVLMVQASLFRMIIMNRTLSHKYEDGGES